MRINPSTIGTIKQCPLKYHFSSEKVEGIKIKSSGRDIGIAVHRTIANTLNGKEVEEGMSEDELIVMREKKKDYENCVEVSKKVLEEEGEPELVEAKIKVKPWNDLPLLVGIVDFFSKNGTIIDWKTGRSDIYLNDGMKLQGKFYEVLLKEKGYNVNKILFVNLRSGKKIEIPKITDGWLRNKIIEAINEVKLHPLLRRPSYLCDYCEYQIECKFMGKTIWEL
jgi:CRISPR/Cas system-associated exonuclease Cas4 (RecB family)